MLGGKSRRGLPTIDPKGSHLASNNPELNPLQTKAASRRDAALIALAGVAAWLVHFTAPQDAMDDDQLKPWGYAADIVLHGRWMIQTDYEGAFMSKPPLYQWLCALVAGAGAGVGPLAMYIPSGLAVIGCGLLCRSLGARWFGARAGFLAGLAFVLSTLTIKHLCMARTDGLFAFTVALTAAAGWFAWNADGMGDRPAGGWSAARWWLLFWLAASLATMTKGPLGLVLGAFGLAAAVWERRRGGLNRWALIGALLWLAIVGGWFWLAVREGGHGVIDRMIGRELIGHALHHETEDRGLFSRWYRPPLYFVSRYLPWSVPALCGLVRVVTRPASGDLPRRAERYLSCWFWLGLFVFCAAPHQRADLLMPLIPPAAILAGREVAVWTAGLSLRRRRALTGVAAAAILAVSFAWHHVGRLKDTDVAHTQAVLKAAEKLRAAVGKRPGRVEFLETTWDAQWVCGVKQPLLKAEQMAAALAGDAPVYVWARDNAEVEAVLAPIRGRIDVVASEPGANGVVFAIYTNAPGSGAPK